MFRAGCQHWNEGAIRFSPGGRSGARPWCL